MKNVHKRKVPLVKQVSQTECGLACMTMLLNYYKSNECLADLQMDLDVGRDGINLFEMRNYLREKNFDARIYKIEKNLGEIEQLRRPLIVYWEKKHFVVVEKMRGGEVWLNDPGIGRRKLSLEEFKQGYSGYMLLAEPTNNFKRKKEKTEQPWRYIMSKVSSKIPLMILILLTMIISYGISLLVTESIQHIIDDVMNNSTIDNINRYIYILIVLAITYIGNFLFQAYKQIKLDVYLSQKLEGDTFKKLLSLPYAFFEKRSNGDILYRLSCISSVKEMIVSELMNGVIDMGSIFILFIYMLHKSILLTIFVLCIAALEIGLLCIFNPKVKAASEVEIQENAKAYSMQIEAVSAIAAVKMSSIEDEIYNNWSAVYKNSLEKFTKRIKYIKFETIIMGSVQLFGPTFILLIGVFFYLQKQISMGEVIAFQTLTAMFLGAVLSVFNMYTQFLIADNYAVKVGDIWSAKEIMHNGSIEKEFEGNIEIKNLDYSYNKNSKRVLNNINVEIKSGQKVAIVGESGSGKSTLAKILIGLFEVDSGQILYDGINLNDFDKKSLLKQIGIVPQDAMLFNKSIGENISLSNPMISEEQIIEAAKMARIHDEIEQMPMKYNTIISDMGENLSGGQRQRILIARALVKKPKLLVMDEATSSLDTINEAAISDYLSNIGCSRIVIAHRLSTIIDSDIIFMMKNGEIICQGTHEELLAICPEYNNLYSKNGQDLHIVSDPESVA